jgi:hypothetical protein
MSRIRLNWLSSSHGSGLRRYDQPANMTLLYLTCANRLLLGSRKTIRNPPGCRVFSVGCLRYLFAPEA